MATQESIEKAAQAWCTPTTGHLAMEPDLAYVFADMLDELKAENVRLRGHIANLILVSEGWHSVEDCHAEGRSSCEFCAAIKQAKERTT